MGSLALAAEVGDAAMKPIVDGVSTVLVVAGDVFMFMAGNPYLVVLLSASLLTVGIRLFRKAKSAAR